MNKKLVVGLLALTLTMCGCAEAKDGGDAAPAAETATSEAASTEASTEAEEPEKEAESEALEETSDAAASNVIATDLFEITIPEEFAGIYEADVTDGQISIFHKESKDAGFGGLAFSVWARKLPSEFAGGPYIKIGELVAGDGTRYEVVKGEATEVQWDYNQDMPEDFEKLYGAMDTILESITATNGGTYMHGAGMKGEDIYGYFLSNIAEVIGDGADEKAIEDLGLAPEILTLVDSDPEHSLDKIGYAFYDTDVDGVDELFVGDIESGAIYDVFTVVDGEPTHVFSGGARDRYYIYNDGFVCNEYSNGAGDSGWNVYALESNSVETVLQFGYRYNSDEDAEKPWFRTWDGEVFDPITEEEYNDAEKDKEAMLQKTAFKPLTDYAVIDYSKVDLSKYSTFTEIVDSLKAGMAYANANIDGVDVLLVASGCYDNLDGHIASIDSSVFMYDDNGSIVYLGYESSGGTATPLAIGDGKLILATHHTVEKVGIVDGKLAVTEKAVEEFDEEGNSTFLYFEKDDKSSVEVEDDTYLTKLFDDYNNAEIIDFQEVIK